MYQIFADKLLDFTEHHPEIIAEQYCKAIRTNTRTPSLHNLSEDRHLPAVVNCYKSLKNIYNSENLFEASIPCFSNYAKVMYKEGIPLCESIYCLILMRRHIWLSAEVQALFINVFDMHQAVDSINRVILLFDYGIYITIQHYEQMPDKTGAGDYVEIP